MKTITMLIDETKKKLANTINESGLPFSVIEIILSEMLGQVRELAREELRRDIEQSKEQEKKEDTKETK